MTLYAEQKMHVTEYQPIINELFDVLNTLSGVAINKIYQQADWQALYFSEASRLFSNDFNVDAPPLRLA